MKEVKRSKIWAVITLSLNAFNSSGKQQQSTHTEDKNNHQQSQSDSTQSNTSRTWELQPCRWSPRTEVTAGGSLLLRLAGTLRAAEEPAAGLCGMPHRWREGKMDLCEVINPANIAYITTLRHAKGSASSFQLVAALSLLLWEVEVSGRKLRSLPQLAEIMLRPSSRLQKKTQVLSSSSATGHSLTPSESV